MLSDRNRKLGKEGAPIIFGAVGHEIMGETSHSYADRTFRGEPVISALQWKDQGGILREVRTQMEEDESGVRITVQARATKIDYLMGEDRLTYSAAEELGSCHHRREYYRQTRDIDAFEADRDALYGLLGSAYEKANEWKLEDLKLQQD